MAIISKLDNCGWLFCQHEALKQLYRFFETCLQGKYKKRDYENQIRIDLDSGIFAMLQTYKLKPYKRAFFETHKEYVDFQLTIHGSECFMIGDSKDFKISKSKISGYITPAMFWNASASDCLDGHEYPSRLQLSAPANATTTSVPIAGKNNVSGAQGLAVRCVKE